MQKLLTSTSNHWLEKSSTLGGISLIDHLYNRLDGLYPQKFRSAFPDAKSLQNWRESWAEGFFEDKITMSEIKKGLVNSRKMYDWPPSYREFYTACKVIEAPAQIKHLGLPKLLTEADKEKGREFLAGIHSMLNKGASA
jgi:hypothetical protein